MTQENYEGSYYLISHLVLITGLTDRTLRSYLSSGILQGEKINGLWHFTAEQVEQFLRHPAVKPSIQANRNALVYDFMIDTKKQEPQICVIMDLPGCDVKETAAYFCYSISTGDYRNIQFSFDDTGGTPRVILKGKTADVLKLVNEYK